MNIIKIKLGNPKKYVNKDLEPNKWVKITSFVGRKKEIEFIEKYMQSYNK